MPSSGLTRNNGLNFRDGLWLGAALAVHAGLLLVPLEDDPPTPSESEEIVVELRLVTPPANPFVRQEPERPHDPPPLPDPIREKEPPLAAATQPEAVVEIAEAEAVEVAPEPPESNPPDRDISTAILLRSAAERDWHYSVEEPHRKLGIPPAPQIPENWLPGIDLEENRFDGKTVPRRVEILDRWISNDGAHNVVLNTPNGETLCGRARAWDPMQPLVEHVMQFRLCGGGGKRTFEMPQRYHRD